MPIWPFEGPRHSIFQHQSLSLPDWRSETSLPLRRADGTCHRRKPGTVSNPQAPDYARASTNPIYPQGYRAKHPSGSPKMRSEEHTSELQSLMRISYAVFCLKKKKQKCNTEPKTTSYITIET